MNDLNAGTEGVDAGAGDVNAGAGTGTEVDADAGAGTANADTGVGDLNAGARSADRQIFAPLRMPPWRFLVSKWPYLAIVHLAVGIVLAVVTLLCVAFFPLLPVWMQALSALETARSRPLLPASLRGRRRLPHVAWRARAVVGWRQSIVVTMVGPVVAIFAFVAAVLYATVAVCCVRLMRGDGIVIRAEAGPSLVGPQPLWARAGFVLAFAAATVVFAYACTAVSLAQVAMSHWLARADAEALERQVDLLAKKNVDLTRAFEDERRRIERELHDGPQQHLASAAIQLGLARARLARAAGDAGGDAGDAHGGPGPSGDAHRAGNTSGAGAGGVDSLLDIAQSELEAAASALRGALNGLRPRILEEQGLGADIEAMVESAPIPVSVEYDVPGRLEPAVESSLHFVVAEFLANSYRHARATRATIALSWEGGVLTLRMVDDGVGGADSRNGTGIVGMANRIKLLGGRLRIESPVGGPTVIVASCPVTLREAQAP
ncbi:MAG: histidine kinase [Actinomycetaceae bacterium]|nr:histidine kinase [Actinomycetaceae bacterium]